MSGLATSVYSIPVMYKYLVPSGTTGVEQITLRTTPLPTDEFLYLAKVKTSFGLDRLLVATAYDKTTGILTVQAPALQMGDLVVISGSWNNK